MATISPPLMGFCVGDASLVVKNTFIGSQPRCSLERSKRSASAPAKRDREHASRLPLLLTQASLLTGYRASEELIGHKYQREPRTMGIIYLEGGRDAKSNRGSFGEMKLNSKSLSAPDKQGKFEIVSDSDDEAATTAPNTDDILPHMQLQRIACQSKGSVDHDAGRCRPCAWFWKDGGCYKDINCGYCHMCESGAVKSRKQQNRILNKRKKMGGAGSVFELLLERALPLGRAAPLQ